MCSVWRQQYVVFTRDTNSDSTLDDWWSCVDLEFTRSVLCGGCFTDRMVKPRRYQVLYILGAIPPLLPKVFMVWRVVMAQIYFKFHECELTGGFGYGRRKRKPSCHDIVGYITHTWLVVITERGRLYMLYKLMDLGHKHSGGSGVLRGASAQQN